MDDFQGIKLSDLLVCDISAESSDTAEQQAEIDNTISAQSLHRNQPSLPGLGFPNQLTVEDFIRNTIDNTLHSFSDQRTGFESIVTERITNTIGLAAVGMDSRPSLGFYTEISPGVTVKREVAEDGGDVSGKGTNPPQGVPSNTARPASPHNASPDSTCSGPGDDSTPAVHNPPTHTTDRKRNYPFPLSQEKREQLSRKRSRYTFSPAQLLTFEKLYEKEHYPKRIDLIEMEREFKIPEDKLRTWFQNRRAKDKRDRLLKSGPQGPVIAPALAQDQKPNGNLPRCFSPQSVMSLSLTRPGEPVICEQSTGGTGVVTGSLRHGTPRLIRPHPTPPVLQTSGKNPQKAGDQEKRLPFCLPFPPGLLTGRPFPSMLNCSPLPLLSPCPTTLFCPTLPFSAPSSSTWNREGIASPGGSNTPTPPLSPGNMWTAGQPLSSFPFRGFPGLLPLPSAVKSFDTSPVDTAKNLSNKPNHVKGKPPKAQAKPTPTTSASSPTQGFHQSSYNTNALGLPYSLRNPNLAGPCPLPFSTGFGAGFYPWPTGYYPEGIFPTPYPLVDGMSTNFGRNQDLCMVESSSSDEST